MSSKQIEKRFDMLKTFIAVLIALGLTFLVIAIVSDDPLAALQAFIFGPLKNMMRIGNVIELMTPLMFTGTAICIMYQANQFNLIGEGAFLIGANLASWFAISFGATLPAPLGTIGALLVGAMAGIVGASIPAILKVKWKANEVVSSIMMNYILLQLSNFILMYVTKDAASGLQASFKIPVATKLLKIFPGTRIHLGTIIALLVVAAAYIFIYKTKWGYEIRMTGANINFAKYSGISVMGVMLYAQLIGGGIAGLGGASEMLGLYDRFIWYGYNTNYGFDGILVAILAKNNPIFVPFAALFLAYLRIGSDVMNRVSDVPVEFIQVVQAIVIMLVAAEMFLSKWKHKLIVNNSKKQFEVKGAV